VFVTAGACAGKRLVFAPPSYVTFPWREHPQSEAQALVIVEQDNPRRRFGIPCADLLAIHRFIGIVPRDITGESERERTLPAG